jgi:hypothetical protein
MGGTGLVGWTVTSCLALFPPAAAAMLAGGALVGGAGVPLCGAGGAAAQAQGAQGAPERGVGAGGGATGRAAAAGQLMLLAVAGREAVLVCMGLASAAGQRGSCPAGLAEVSHCCVVPEGWH